MKTQDLALSTGTEKDELIMVSTTYAIKDWIKFTSLFGEEYGDERA